MRPIDADALIKDIAESIKLADKWEKEAHEKKDKYEIKCAIDTRKNLMYMILRVKKIPTIDVKPVKHGRWIQLDRDIAVCSECGRHENTLLVDSYPYCHCGAKMDLKDGEK